ncbi:MAG: tetratricopeptide repeat protein [Planctomycetes bacterium]|nr:tetratricopeptide repeat protein [Planctomycetota bacterium]
MTASHPAATHPPSDAGTEGTLARGLSGLGLVLLLLAIAALAVVPDEAVLRGKALWGRSLILGAISCALLAQAAAGRLSAPWTPFLAAALGPAAVAALFPLHSTLTSPSLARDEIWRLALVPTTVFGAAALLGDAARRRRFLAVLALGVLVAGGHAVAQRAGGLVPIGIEPAVRAEGGFGNPVFLGAFLVLVTPVLLAEALLGGGRLRWLFAAAGGVAVAALLATASAGAWLGFGAALVLGLCLTVGRSRALGIALSLLAVVAVVIVGTRLGMILRPRAHTLIWRDTWSMFLAHPNGVGPGQFQLAFLPYASDELLAIYPRSSSIVNDAHNEPLQVLAELGVPGFLALLAALVALLACARATLRRELRERHLLGAALGGVLGSATQSLVSPDLRFGVTSLVLGVMLGFAASFGAPSTRPVPWGRFGRALVAALGLLGLATAVAESRRQTELHELVQPDAPPPRDAADDARVLELRRALREHPDDVQAHFDLGTALAEQGRDAAAAEAFADALELAPGNASILRNLGLVESRGHMDAAAVTHLRPVVESAPDDDLARLMLGWALLRTGDVPGAAGHARAVLARTPDHADARYLLAYAAFVQGDVRSALAETETLLADHPDHRKGRLLLEVLRE